MFPPGMKKVRGANLLLASGLELCNWHRIPRANPKHRSTCLSEISEKGKPPFSKIRT